MCTLSSFDFTQLNEACAFGGKVCQKYNDDNHQDAKPQRIHFIISWNEMEKGFWPLMVHNDFRSGMIFHPPRYPWQQPSAHDDCKESWYGLKIRTLRQLPNARTGQLKWCKSVCFEVIYLLAIKKVSKQGPEHERVTTNWSKAQPTQGLHCCSFSHYITNSLPHLMYEVTENCVDFCVFALP